MRMSVTAGSKPHFRLHVDGAVELLSGNHYAGMHPADINASLIKAGSSQSAIASHLQVSPAAISAVVRGHSKSARIAAAISEVTGLRMNALWPGRYPRLLPKAKAGRARK